MLPTERTAGTADTSEVDIWKIQFETRMLLAVQEASQKNIRTMTAMLAAYRCELEDLWHMQQKQQTDKQEKLLDETLSDLACTFQSLQDICMLDAGKNPGATPQMPAAMDAIRKAYEKIWLATAHFDKRLLLLEQAVEDIGVSKQSREPDAMQVSIDTRASSLQDPTGDRQSSVVAERMNEDSIAPEQKKGDPLERSASTGSPQGMGYEFLEYETQELYIFGNSTWDLVVFMGTKTLGPGVAFVLAFLLSFKVFMQVLFAAIVRFNFTNPSVNQNTIDGANAWRESIGHNMIYVDSLTQVSLTARVCEGDVSLDSSGAQAALIESLGQYLEPNHFGIAATGTLFEGRTLCLLALACWYLQISKEMDDALNLFRALWFLPWASATKIVRYVDGSYSLQHVCLRRCIFVGLVLIYRLGIAAVLVWAGTLFLVHTIGVSDLILNAVALEVIISIDELFFDALAPKSCEYFIAKLCPITMPRLPHWKNVDVKSALIMFMLPVSLITVNFSILAPMVEDLETVLRSFCGGDRDFAWTVNKLDMVVMAPTLPYTGSFNKNPSVSTVAIRESIFHGDATDKQTSVLWRSELDDLIVESSYSFQETLDVLQPHCRDLIDGPSSLLDYLQAVLEDGSITNCSDVTSWCTSVSYGPERKPDGGKGIMARALCPQTCGCFDLRSSLFVVEGCPTDCMRTSNSDHFQAFQEGSCTQEPTVEELQQSAVFVAWLDQMRSFAEAEGGANESYAASVLQAADLMWQEGCAAISSHHLALLEPCDSWGSLPFKTLRNLCPLACDCLRGSKESKQSCPWSCQSCSFDYCSDLGPNCAGGTVTEPCSCWIGQAVVYGTDEYGYSMYTCCTDGSGQKDVCGKFEANMYCDLCDGAVLNTKSTYVWLGIERNCTVAQESCKIAHHCLDTCENLQSWFTTATACCETSATNRTS